MDRRRFAVGTLGGSVLAAFTAAIGRAQPAAADGPRQGPVGPQENILFSETDYGHWGDWVSLHVPQVKLDGGVLTVSASEETIAKGSSLGLAPGSYVRLSVADTGQGMDAATIARAAESIGKLPAAMRALEQAEPWPVRHSQDLAALIERTRRNLPCGPCS